MKVEPRNTRNTRRSTTLQTYKYTKHPDRSQIVTCVHLYRRSRSSSQRIHPDQSKIFILDLQNRMAIIMLLFFSTHSERPQFDSTLKQNSQRSEDSWNATQPVFHTLF